jgi:hypothetical protein
MPEYKIVEGACPVMEAAETMSETIANFVDIGCQFDDITWTSTDGEYCIYYIRFIVE